MDRTAILRELELERTTALFRRTLANWAHDLLRHRPRIQWPQPKPADDFRDRNWSALYTGSVLDD